MASLHDGNGGRNGADNGHGLVQQVMEAPRLCVEEAEHLLDWHACLVGRFGKESIADQAIYNKLDTFIKSQIACDPIAREDRKTRRRNARHIGF